MKAEFFMPHSITNMSLAKRKELADLGNELTALNNVRNAAYDRLRKATAVSVEKDFRSFFTEHGFSIVIPPLSSYSAINKPALMASYQNMKAVLVFNNDDPYFFTIQSDIKGSDIEHSFRISIDNPKAAVPRLGMFSIPQDEAKRLEFDLQQARTELEKGKNANSGLTETFTVISLISEKVKGQAKNIGRQEKDFASHLEHLFN